MQIRAEESAGHRKEIEGFDQKVAISETGTVLEAGDGIARVYGLETPWPASCWILARTSWPGLEPGRGQRRRRPLGRLRDRERGRHGQAHR